MSRPIRDDSKRSSWGRFKTIGISPKATLAFVLPAAGTAVLALLDQVLSPDMDPTLKVAIVGLVNAVLAFAGAYAGRPGNVVPDTGGVPPYSDTPAFRGERGYGIVEMAFALVLVVLAIGLLIHFL